MRQTAGLTEQVSHVARSRLPFVPLVSATENSIAHRALQDSDIRIECNSCSNSIDCAQMHDAAGFVNNETPWICVVNEHNSLMSC